jgi:hypothetical protein
MVAVETILCQTQGNIASATPTALINPMTGLSADLPEGAIVKEISIYRDGDNAVTTGCTIQLGIEGSTSKYIGVAESLSTTDLNNGHLIHKYVTSDKGITAGAELRLTINNPMTTGGLIFEVTYAVYA